MCQTSLKALFSLLARQLEFARDLPPDVHWTLYYHAPNNDSIMNFIRENAPFARWKCLTLLTRLPELMEEVAMAEGDSFANLERLDTITVPISIPHQVRYLPLVIWVTQRELSSCWVTFQSPSSKQVATYVNKIACMSTRIGLKQIGKGLLSGLPRIKGICSNTIIVRTPHSTLR